MTHSNCTVLHLSIAGCRELVSNLALLITGSLDTEDLRSVPGIASNAPEVIKVILVEDLRRAYTMIKSKVRILAAD